MTKYRRVGWRIVAVSLCALAGAPAWAQPRPDPGSPVTQLIDLAEFKGKVVYLDFWASWCAPCRQSFPWMNELHRQFGKDGLVILAVNVDQVRSDAEGFLKRFPPEFAVRFDPQGVLAQRYKVRGMPTSALLDREGKTILVHEGFRDADRKSLEQSIRSALH